MRLSPACLIRKLQIDPVGDLQDGREQLRMCSEQQAKRNRKHSTYCRTGTRGTRWLDTLLTTGVMLRCFVRTFPLPRAKLC